MANLLMLILLAVIGTVGIGIYLNTRSADFTGFRAFDVTTGIANSIAYKANTFRSMISQFTTMNWCIGMGVMETRFGDVTGIDFDLGYMMVFYGIAGCMLYIWMLHDICTYRDDMHARYAYLNRLLALVIVLSGLTTGVFFDLRVLSIFATLLYVDILDVYFQPIRISCPNDI